ncbi:AAA family ATPase [Microvirga sp. P5_D2]
MLSIGSVKLGNRQDERDAAVDLRIAFLVLRRRRRIISITLLACLALGAVIYLITPPLYTASSRLLLDRQPSNFFQQGSVPGQAAPDPVEIQNQIEVIKSDKIALAVIDKLQLRSQLIRGRTLLEAINLSPFRGSMNPTEAGKAHDEIRKTRRDLRERLSTARVPNSNVVEISFTSTDAGLSAAVTNEIVDAFIRSQLALRQEAAPRAQEMLRERVVLTTALPPSRPDEPRGTLILGGAILAGIIISGIGAFLREYADRTVRTPEQIEAATDVNCIGLLPDLRPRNCTSDVPFASDTLDKQVSRHKALPRMPVGYGQRAGTARGNPNSAFIKALQNIKTTTELRFGRDRVCIVGITSTLSGEGKSTTAANFASLLARTGEPTLLVDCDFQKAQLTKWFAPDAKKGVEDIVGRSTSWRDLIRRDCNSLLHFAPANLEASPWDTSSVLTSTEMMEFLREAREFYRFIVLDLPPLAPSIDVRAAAHLADAFLLVVEWGKTSPSLVRRALSLADPVRGKLLGTVLNKVDLARLRDWDSDAILVGGGGTAKT